MSISTAKLLRSNSKSFPMAKVSGYDMSRCWLKLCVNLNCASYGKSGLQLNNIVRPNEFSVNPQKSNIEPNDNLGANCSALASKCPIYISLHRQEVAICAPRGYANDHSCKIWFCWLDMMSALELPRLQSMSFLTLLYWQVFSQWDWIPYNWICHFVFRFNQCW